MPYRFVRQKIRDFVVYRILGIGDSPHRIALGVAAALFITFTPTMGIQMLLAFGLAALIGGNRMVTLPIVWISNPLTAVPMYYANWCVGHLILYRSLEFDPTVRATLAKLFVPQENFGAYVDHLWDAAFWEEILRLLAKCGVELWLGSLVVSATIALISYPICRRAVIAYRRARHHDHHETPPSPPEQPHAQATHQDKATKPANAEAHS